MPRSSKKGPFVAPQIQEEITRMNAFGTKGTIEASSRATTVLPYMIGHTFNVYNGKRYLPVFVTDQMIGHKLGEFSPSRRFRSHIKKYKKLKK
jgi:small subunit ribosomal protein S19